MLRNIYTDNELVAIFLRHKWDENVTTFITNDEMQMQMGMIVSPAGSNIAPHRHNPVERTIYGTSEFLYLKVGNCVADFYDRENAVIESVDLTEGDMLLILGGAHGFRSDDEFKFIEIKQGPYLGVQDKKRIFE